MQELQDWLIQNNKCVGPPCVQEADTNEVTWFSQSNIFKGKPKKWAFPHFVDANEIDEKWCLPVDIFNKLQGFITNRRDRGFHNQWAKSWKNKDEAEAALSAVLFKTDKKKIRSIKDDWEPSFKLN